jgi:hypothetical protein
MGSNVVKDVLKLKEAQAVAGVESRRNSRLLSVTQLVLIVLLYSSLQFANLNCAINSNISAKRDSYNASICNIRESLSHKAKGNIVLCLYCFQLA